jgi:hypothetical protein
MAALLIQLACATLGVFSKRFKDNLVQKIGLTGVAFTSAALAWYTYQYHSALATFELHSASWALYCIGTAWKLRGGDK